MGYVYSPNRWNKYDTWEHLTFLNFLMKKKVAKGS